MNDRHHTPWSRLAAAARRAPAFTRPADAEEPLAPAGFATRVVARAGLRGGMGGFAPAFERLAARALGFACIGAMAFALWSQMPSTAEARSTDSSGTSSVTDAYLDPVGDLLEVVHS